MQQSIEYTFAAFLVQINLKKKKPKRSNELKVKVNLTDGSVFSEDAWKFIDRVSFLHENRSKKVLFDLDRDQVLHKFMTLFSIRRIVVSFDVDFPFFVLFIDFLVIRNYSSAKIIVNEEFSKSEI